MARVVGIEKAVLKRKPQFLKAKITIKTLVVQKKSRETPFNLFARPSFP